MTTYVASDLHVHDGEHALLFDEESQAAFVALAKEVAEKGGELILAGDTFELTGMTPPRYGLEAFFTEALPAALHANPELKRETAFRSVAAQLDAIRARFPPFFRALGELAQAGKLTLLAGNHDFALTTMEGREALGQVLGLSTPLAIPEVKAIRQSVVVAHGHAFDPMNSTAEGGLNRGAVLTGCIFQALLPALEALGVSKAVRTAITAVRPEEEVVAAIEPELDAAVAGTLARGFLRLLERNGYFEGGGHGPIWLSLLDVPLISNVLKVGLGPRKVREALADDTALKDALRFGAGRFRQGAGPVGLPEGMPEPKWVVLGHSHVREERSGYLNLGSWAVHLTGLTAAAREAADRTLPVLCLEDDDTATLRDARRLAEVGVLTSCPVLWRFPEA